MAQPVIETQGLTLFYGAQRGIVNVNLSVLQGEVFGFLGPNGAGKTTTLRVVLDVIRPNRGSARLFGLDCQSQGAQARRRVGYLPGELSFPDQLRGRDYLSQVEALRRQSIDADYRRQLCARLDLDISRRIREYSRGNKQKLGLVAAFMHQPDLLILDEPTTGLDPLVQQTVLHLVREARSEGRTVFFCSHILPEVQAVCDRVGIIRHGQIVRVERVDALIGRRFRRLKLQMATPAPQELFAQEGVRLLEKSHDTFTVEISQNMDAFLAALAPFGILDIESEHLSLEEVFLSYYGDGDSSHV